MTNSRGHNSAHVLNWSIGQVSNMSFVGPRGHAIAADPPVQKYRGQCAPYLGITTVHYISVEGNCHQHQSSCKHSVQRVLLWSISASQSD